MAAISDLPTAHRERSQVPWRALRDCAANGSHLVSLDRCRQLLGSGCKLTDGELNTIREQLYGLADVAVAAVLEGGPVSSPPPRRSELTDVKRPFTAARCSLCRPTSATISRSAPPSWSSTVASLAETQNDRRSMPLCGDDSMPRARHKTSRRIDLASKRARGAVIYARVSTKEQAQNLSIGTQTQACRRYCEQNDLDVLEVFVDAGESAKTIARPEFQRMIAYCHANSEVIRTVVVHSLSRFARDQFGHLTVRATLAKVGVTLRSVNERVDDTPSGKFIESVLAASAQLDNDQKSQRTREGMMAALATGRWTFPPPLGYIRARDGLDHASITQDPQRAPLIRAAFELVASGLHSTRQTLKQVTTLGLRTRTGQRVGATTFHNLLRNPIYAGLLVVKRWGIEPHRGNFQPIISESLFEATQAVLEGRRLAVTPHARNHPDFPLRRFVRCHACETPLTGSWSKGRNGRYAYYRCPKEACRSVNIRKAELEARFVDYLDSLRPKPEFLALFREIVLDTWKEKQVEATKATELLSRRVSDLKARTDRLVETFVFDKAIDKATYDEHLEKLRVESAVAEVALHDAKLEHLDVEIVVAFAEHVLGNAGRMWSEFSLEQKQRLQAVLFPRGVTFGIGGFGTAETAVIFRLLHSVGPNMFSEASPTGFEPVLPT